MSEYQEILSYVEMVQRERVALQKGMNFRVRGGVAGYSIILMSVRPNAPYQDRWHNSGSHAGLLEYEGHDVPRLRGSSVDPKSVDQLLALPSGKPTDNGKFFQAASDYRAGRSPPEVVQVYEKVSDGIWCDRGRYELVDATMTSVPVERSTTATTMSRRVCRFFLRPTTTPSATTQDGQRELASSRQIPTWVKVEVWKRDQGRCVECQSKDNLHFDHDVPFSKGGSSITPENVRLLCARHNLVKSNKIV